MRLGFGEVNAGGNYLKLFKILIVFKAVEPRKIPRKKKNSMTWA